MSAGERCRPHGSAGGLVHDHRRLLNRFLRDHDARLAACRLSGARHARKAFHPKHRDALAVGRPMRIAHVAFEIPDLANFPAPSFWTTYSCICPWESASERNASQPSRDCGKPCTRGRRIADVLGHRDGRARTFDIYGERLAERRGFAGRCFNPRATRASSGESATPAEIHVKALQRFTVPSVDSRRRG